MPLDLTAVGKPIGPVTRRYGWRDAVLYALAVGAGFDELVYCYEKGLKVLPTFSLAATFDFFWQVGRISGADARGVLHAGQEFFFEAPLPVEGVLATDGEIVRYDDLGADKGAFIVVDGRTVDGEGRLLVRSRMTVYSRFDGGFGGERTPSTRVEFPDRSPDATLAAQPAAAQPLLYRLTGDEFALHADPKFARRCGFEGPIMHGAGTLGFACLGLIQHRVPDQPERVRYLNCRFTSPLYPGVPIRTRVWQMSADKLLWRTENADTGEVVIDDGIFQYDPVP